MKVLIVGAGKLGYKLATSLSSSEIDITVIDNDAKVVERISENLDALVVNANGIQIQELKDLSISSYDIVIAVTEGDETNMVICTLAKKLGCRKAIARVRNPEYAQELEFLKSSMGIDHIVNPEYATANEIIRYLLNSSSFYWESFAEGRIVMTDFKAVNLPGFVGKRIMDLENINGMLITSIQRNGEIIIPHGASTIHEEDIVYVIGKKDNILNLAKAYKASLPTKYIRNVMVLGGGRISYYLAERLNALGIAVKIIEQDKERCEYLSEHLNNTMVICGDGTDINLLNEEDISLMDALIGVTGLDEENLMMTLMAKQAGVKKVIAKVSKPSYISLIEKLGVDIALSPIDITAGEILKFIRGGRSVSVSMILGGQAEVNEIIADENMPMIGEQIKDMGLPKGIIIGAIVHKGEVIIPNGSSVIYPGDRFVVFCMTEQLPAIIPFFRTAKGGLLSELWNRI